MQRHQRTQVGRWWLTASEAGSFDACSQSLARQRVLPKPNHVGVEQTLCTLPRIVSGIESLLKMWRGNSYNST